ncbi:hypothetical protein LCGC14_1147770 [marine sediment metagenome]|uniref:Uncharacterized protein n=1 Tax=marine sediment metagenome TaxID=412755 RepID=A0A0F9PEI6_9ZZZZ
MMDWDVRDDTDRGEISGLGVRLSIEIGCPVRYPAYDKGIFECKCGIPFPVFVLKGDRWDEVRRLHKEGKNE